MKKITEGEITSLTRRFFKENGFSILSSLSSKEKLNYTIDGNSLNNKQPDSVFIKNDLVILCEDKLAFKNLFKKQGAKVSDHTKLLAFLESKESKEKFSEKIRIKTGTKDIKVSGCLSSLKPGNKNLFIVDPLLLNIQIEWDGDHLFVCDLVDSHYFSSYFDKKSIQFQL